MHRLRPVRPARAVGLVTTTLVVLLAACGGGDDASDASAPPPEASDAADKTPTTIVAGDTAVTIAETDLGSVLADAEGFTLYAFLNDAPNTSNCNGPCAQTWPPLAVEDDFGVGLIGAGFATTTRADGSTQLSIDERPLYRFSGDQAPGDTDGQGVNGKWFAVDPSGRLLDGSSQVDVAAARTALGDVLVDAEGRTLYAFLADANGVSACNDQCAANWPPLVLDGSLRVGDGVTTAFGTTARADGTVQLTAAGQPLYRFSGDGRPGDVNGQNVNGKWFVVDLAGVLVQPGA
jgi:predicted lipoprotein with Yx(FWY)xxD motif